MAGRDLEVRDVGLLAQVNRARSALAEIETVEDAIQLASFAESLRYAARQAKAGMDAENAAAEVRLRAERRAGGLLSESVRHGGDRRSESRSHDATLKDLGVTKSASSRYQRLADVPEETFEAYVESRRKRGEEITTSRLLELGRMQAATERRTTATVEYDGDGLIEIEHGDFREVFATHDVAGAIVITDPPYPREYLGEWRDMATVTRERGCAALIAMCGQTILPEALQAITAGGWQYRWIGAYLTPGATQRVWGPRIATAWKPILIFDHGSDRDFLMRDVFLSGSRDKDHHEWGQSESGTADLVETFSKPGQLVVDPFLGGGTTAVVCKALGRRFLGCDVDADAVGVTLERLAGVLAA